MKNKIFKYVSWLAISALIIVFNPITIFASEINKNEAVAIITFDADSDDVICLSGNNTELYSKNNEGKFELTFNEPGDYFYTISDGESEYIVQIDCSYNENNVLVASVTASEKNSNEKTFIDFKTKGTALGGTITSTPKTGDNIGLKSVYIMLAFAGVSGIFLCFLYLSVRREEKMRMGGNVNEKNP